MMRLTPETILLCSRNKTAIITMKPIGAAYLFDLLTHCGIDEVRLDTIYLEAAGAAHRCCAGITGADRVRAGL